MISKNSIAYADNTSTEIVISLNCKHLAPIGRNRSLLPHIEKYDE